MKILKGRGSALTYTTHHQSPPRHTATDHISLAVSVQSIPYPPHPPNPCFPSLDEKVHVRALLRQWEVLVRRSLLHLNAVTEEAGWQVPVTTIFQLLAFFSATCSVMIHKSFRALWLILCDSWHEFNLICWGLEFYLPSWICLLC